MVDDVAVETRVAVDIGVAVVIGLGHVLLGDQAAVEAQMAERSAGCTLKTEQRVNEEASYEKATVRKQKFRVIVYNFS